MKKNKNIDFYYNIVLSRIKEICIQLHMKLSLSQIWQ